MLKLGIIDETGRMTDADEAEDMGLPLPLRERLVAHGDGSRAFMLIPGDRSQTGEDIYITQRDVREVQNAKAAVAAGIITLLSKAGLRADDVGRVYLAGGFGNYIRVQSALDIGLLLPEFKGRVIPAGNAAGAGAVWAMLSERSASRLLSISQKMRYIELSASPEFTNAYVDCMCFE
jgi:uncharacterized 2Fe-2S/4Fe-4S cluster protein (DUF4445 family)